MGLGSPARGGHHLHSEPLGHWDAVTILMPIHLIYCCHLSSLRRADKSAPRLNVDLSFMFKKVSWFFVVLFRFVFFRGNKEGLTKENSPPLGAFRCLPRVCPITECLGVWWPLCTGGWHVHPCQHGTSTMLPCQVISTLALCHSGRLCTPKQSPPLCLSQPVLV